MNWPGPFEFALYLFFALFLSWIKAVLCLAAAVLIRPRAISAAVAALVGVGEVAMDMGLGLFFAGLLDIYNDLALALAALASVAWWGIGRALYAIVRIGFGRSA